MDRAEKVRRFKAVLWMATQGFDLNANWLKLLYVHDRIFGQGAPEILPADSDEIGDKSGCKSCGSDRIFYVARKDSLGRRFIQGTCKDCLGFRSILQSKNKRKT